MAKRGRKPKHKIDWGNFSGTSRSALALSLLLVGVVSFLSFFAGFASDSPVLNSKLRIILVDSFGLLTIFIPLLLIYSAFIVVGTVTWKYVKPKYFIAGVVSFVCLLGITGVMSGTVGEALQTGTARLISLPGAVIFYFLLLLFVVVVVSNKGLDHWLTVVLEFIKKFTDKFVNIKQFDEDEDEKPREVTSPQLGLNMPGDGHFQAPYNQYAGGASVQSEFVSPGVADLPLIHSEKKKLLEVIAPPASPVGEDGDLVGVEMGGSLTGGSTVLKPGGLPISNRVWEYPPLDLLSNTPNLSANAGDVNERSRMIEHTLDSFGIKAKIARYIVGPSVTQYAISVPTGARANRISALSTDIALRLKSPSGSVRIEAPIPGSDLIGIEVPNYSPASVSLRSVLDTPTMRNNKSKLAIPIGIDVSGTIIVEDISKMPHCLVAGATNSGKSVMLNAIISSLLFRCSPQECRFIMIDPKMVELTQYDGIPHLLAPVVTDYEHKAVSALAWAVSEMERRLEAFKNSGSRNLADYNAKAGFQSEPYIVIVVDEFAELMMVASSDVERYITRITQKARAAGIHLILATQRPSVNVITGTIKANIPTRMAFRVASNTDSRVILDQSGAETLIGRGDMLYIPPISDSPKRVQGVYVMDQEINAIVEFLKSKGGPPEYIPEILEQKVGTLPSDKKYGGGNDELDSKMIEAINIVFADGKASASHLQRRLKIGYSRAASLVDAMQEAGIVSRQNGSKPREVLLSSPDDAINRLQSNASGDNDFSTSDF